jgi:probable rRNA maturation factor
MKPTIHLQDARWKKTLHPYCKTIGSIVAAVNAKGEISIVLADDDFVQNLNKQYRGKNKPTNVLSFPNEDEPLGDVILAFETVAREAEEQGKTFRDHAAHLIVHGILHLMGYDHEDEGEADKMEAREAKILKKLGIANPYL